MYTQRILMTKYILDIIEKQRFNDAEFFLMFSKQILENLAHFNWLVSWAMRNRFESLDYLLNIPSKIRSYLISPYKRTSFWFSDRVCSYSPYHKLSPFWKFDNLHRNSIQYSSTIFFFLYGISCLTEILVVTRNSQI